MDPIKESAGARKKRLKREREEAYHRERLQELTAKSWHLYTIELQGESGETLGIVHFPCDEEVKRARVIGRRAVGVEE